MKKAILATKAKAVKLEYYPLYVEVTYPLSSKDYVSGYDQYKLAIDNGKAELYSDDITIETMKEHYQLDYDVEEKFQYFHQLEVQLLQKEGVQLKKGAKELLDYLHKHHYKIALATSSLASRANQMLETHHMIDDFDVMVYGPDVKRGKPFPDIFLKACEKLGVSPQEAIVLEDSEAGIQASYDAGIKVICIPDMKYPEKQYEEKTFKILKDLTEVTAYLKSL